MQVLYVCVPVGFVTNGASVPRLLRWIVSPYAGDHIKGDVIHDYMYSMKMFSRADCDRFYREILLRAGVRKTLAFIMWFGVRLGGWISYHKIFKRFK